MGFFNKYPYTDFHELNLDWLLNEITRLKAEVERLSKLGEKIDEVLELLKHYEEMLAYVMGKGLVDVSYYDLYSQVIPETNPSATTWNSQGFCIGKYGNTIVALNCFVNGNDTNRLVFTDFLTGATIGSYDVTAGHSNSCCYCDKNGHFYVACGGGGSTRTSIQEYDIGGNLINEFSLTGYIFWSITCYDEFLYTQSGGKLIKMDLDFNIIAEYQLYNDSSAYTYQGMFADENFIYINNGNTILRADADPLKWRNINRITVVSHEGVTIKQIDVKFPLEVEEGDIYDGKLYLSANTSHIAFIVSSDLYSRNANNCWGRFNNNIGVNEYTQDIYIDEDYEGFMIDGSASKPLPAFALIDLYSKQAITYLNVYINSDIKTLNFISFRRIEIPVVSIHCNNHTMPNIRSRAKEMYISDALFPGQSSYNTIEYHGERLVLNNITFGTSGSTETPDRLIYVNGGLEADGIILNQSASWLYYVVGDGYFRNVTLNISGSKYNIIGNLVIDTTFPIEFVKYGANNNMTPWMLITNDYNRTLDLNEIIYPCLICHAGGTITNLPAGVTLSNVRFVKIERFRFTGNTANTVRTFLMNDASIITDIYTSPV